MFNKSLAVLKSISVNLSILFLLLVACYVLVMRAALYYLPEYKTDITQYLSEITDQTITVSSFSSRWDGFDPVIQVNDLTIESSEQLHIERVSFFFSFFQSVLSLQPKFERVLIEQTDVAVKQTADGHWGILNFSSDTLQDNFDLSSKNETNSFFSLLSIFNGATLNIKDLNAIILKEKKSIRTLRLPTFNINYSDDVFFASGKILQKLGDKSLLNFSLKGRGLLSAEPIKGVLYVEARSSEFFGELLDVYNWQKISILDIEGSTRAWINFVDSDIVSVYGDFQVSELDWKVADLSPPPIRNLAFSYLWQDEINEKHLILDNFAFEWSGNICEPMDLRAVLNNNKINILADKVNVECINELALAVNTLPENLYERLVVSKPKGYLKNVNLTYSSTVSTGEETQAADEFSVEPTLPVEPALIVTELPLVVADNRAQFNNKDSSFTFEAMLDGINLEGFKGSPSAKNLNGYIFADNSSGFVSFLSENFELGFPSLFLDPWDIKRAEGLVSWEILGSDINVSSDGLRLWRKDDSLIYGDFILRLNDVLHEDYLYLALGLQDVLLTDAVKFVPYYIVNNDLYSWLSSALTDGSVSNGIYYGYGSIESSAPENSFTSSIFLQSKAGGIKFEPDWPPVEGLLADVNIQNGNLDISANHAIIADSPLDNLQISLPEVEKGKANSLRVSADAMLTSTLVDYWLLASPIANSTKTIMEQLTIDASAQIHLDLSIPVTNAAESEQNHELEYTINTSIVDGDVLHIPSKLTFEGVTGELSVDSKKGVNAEQIQAALFGEQALLSINTSFQYNHMNKEEPPTQSTKLSMQGKLGFISLFNYFDYPKPDYLNGDFNYTADLSLSSREKEYPLLSIDTDLFGTECLCPLPFAKNINQREDLNISLLLKPQQSYLTATLKSTHMPAVQSELMFVEDKVSFGEFLIGGAKVTNTDLKGLNVAANLKLANLQNWLSFVEDSIEKSPSYNEHSDTESRLKQVQIQVEDLDGFGYLFQKSQILAKPQGANWLFEITGKNANGQITIPQDDAAINVYFEKLNLVSLDKLLDKPVGQDLEAPETTDPRSFPWLSFKAKNIFLENRHIGSCGFDIEPSEFGSIFRNVNGLIKGTKLSGQLNWQFNEEFENTIATFDVVGKDIVSVFEAFELPALISSKMYKTDFAIHWPGPPQAFELGKLSGNLNLSLEDGFLKTEDEKTGVLRLFGVLNAESIKRRLKLDFTDLYKSGVGFDTFNTSASIDQGLLTLTEPLLIDGPAGKYVLNGRSDLATKALDIDMLVELPFSQNVPLAALVLGAPQIGGLVWVADKLLGEPLSALTTSRYDISGSWDEPIVNLQQAMNASKKDRSKERGTRDLGNQP